MNKAKRIVTLCSRCKANYISAGYKLTFAGNTIKSECEFCYTRDGYDYYLEDKDERGTTNGTH